MRATLALGAGYVRAEQILYGGRNFRRKAPQIGILDDVPGRGDGAVREDFTKIAKPFARIPEKSSCDSLDLRENPRTRGKSKKRGFCFCKQLFYFLAGLSAPPQKLILTEHDSSDK